MKGNRAHRVSLSKPALVILQSMQLLGACSPSVLR
jgi:hypothetical protein